MNEKRDQAINIAKGICIILMVIGHSGCPRYLSNFIYMFHMPCFFFISGYLLKDKYAEEPKRGIRNKIKGLYLPFIQWNLIFLFMHSIARVFLNNVYSVRELITKFFGILTMTHTEQLLGGYWFIISLFLVSVFTIILLYATRNLNNLQQIIFFACLIAISLFIAIIIKYPPPFDHKTWIGLAFFLSGLLYRRCDIQIKHLQITGIILLLIPAIVATTIHFGIDTTKGPSIIPFYLVAFCGTLGILCLSRRIRPNHPIGAVLSYVGNRTLYILTFHFLAFKIVSVTYVFIHHLPREIIGQFPVIWESNTWLWSIYSIVGILLPLVIWETVHYLRGIASKQ